ncbi:MAG: chorismate mutase [Pseudohongiellaceae bacterium]
MESKSVPEELQVLREQIDAIDEQLLMDLARRFEVTREVGRIKAENRLQSVDPAREQQKLERLQELAKAHSLNSEFILALFQAIFNEVVANHKEFIRKG